ncbi:hypothetical protein ACT1U9_04405 [Streptomyces sp. BR1]|uniref:hypothetical protein n=1 Tax=Streptomyces sp. BR1 TaxID=1592323 RepID=UPI00402B2BE7
MTTTHPDSGHDNAPADEPATSPWLPLSELTVWLSGGCALLSAALYTTSMAYALSTSRPWDESGAYQTAFVFTLIALLSAGPFLISQRLPATGRTSPVPRFTMWATCLALAGIHLTASLLGTPHLALSGIVGITAVLAVAGFGELTAHGLAAVGPPER